MADVKLCGVCAKNEAARKCDECKIDLCALCTKEVMLQEQTPASMWKPDVTGSTFRAATRKLYVCPKCLKEADFY